MSQISFQGYQNTYKGFLTRNKSSIADEEVQQQDQQQQKNKSKVLRNHQYQTSIDYNHDRKGNMTQLVATIQKNPADKLQNVRHKYAKSVMKQQTLNNDYSNDFTRDINKYITPNREQQVKTSCNDNRVASGQSLPEADNLQYLNGGYSLQAASKTMQAFGNRHQSVDRRTINNSIYNNESTAAGSRVLKLDPLDQSTSLFKNKRKSVAPSVKIISALQSDVKNSLTSLKLPKDHHFKSRQRQTLAPTTT